MIGNVRLAIVVAAALTFCTASYGGTQTGGSKSVPIASVLNADGTLKLDGSVSGNVDLGHYRMSTSPTGVPRFLSQDEIEEFSAADSWVDPNTGWDGRFFTPGVTNTVYTVAIVGSDLYIGGEFTTINNLAADHIAKWNGSVWSGLGSGVNGFVGTIEVNGTDLYVAGSFSTAGGISAGNIAKWDGSNWSALGSIGTPGSDTVPAIAVNGTDLYAVGGVGGSRHILKWNGNAWSEIGNVDDTTNALVLIGTGLYAGGAFHTANGVSAEHIAKWDGSNWSALAGGVDGTVNTMKAMGSNLYVGGEFLNADSMPTNRIAKWDGSAWSALGTGLDTPTIGMTVDGTDLYVVGSFESAGGISAEHIAKWDGSTWSALGSGVSGYRGFGVAVTGANIYMGGYSLIAGGVVTNFAKWDGSTWSAMGQDLSGLAPDTEVNALRTIGTDVYVGGSFSKLGTASISNIAKWNGTAWSAVGGGVNGEIDSMTVSGTDLYVAGGFDTAGGNPANNVAKWNGSTWSALGAGIDGQIFALAANGTDLYAAGSFASAGGNPANNIAKWDGSTWSPLGTGLENLYRAEALAIIGTDVYVGGGFHTAGGVSVENIAKWNGSTWSAVGSGIPSGNAESVLVMAVNGTDLYVGGGFNNAGGVGANNIAKWDGSSWSALGSGTNNDVRSLVFDGNNLYAGSYFTMAGGVSAQGVAKWNGSTWSGLGSGVKSYGEVDALTISGTDLYVGGNNFSLVGNKPASYFTIWHAVCGNGLVDIGEACDDGNLINGDGCDNNCTVSACGNSIIGGSETCDDGNSNDGDGCSATCQIEACWTCSGLPSMCSLLAGGSGCDDGLFCNGTDTCTAGGVCQHTGDPCTGGSECGNVCDEAHATCNLPLNTPCSSDSDLCTDDVCDGAGACTHPDNTAPCDDGNACTVGDACSGGVCAPGGALDCNDNNPCTDDACAPLSGCTNDFNSNPCDDGVFCTVNDTCQNGSCTAGPARDCSDGDNCTNDTCNEAGASCDHGPRLTCGDSFKCGSELCDDGNTTDGDGCQANCTFTPVTVTQMVGDGGTVTTDNGSGATESFPTQTAVTTPNGGVVMIAQTPAVTTPVSGFGVIGQQIFISAPSATFDHPLTLTFITDASVLPPGLSVNDLQISKDGVLLPDCTGPVDQAIPNPCIKSREIDSGTGDAKIIALTSSASNWATVAPAHDSVVTPLPPLTITIPAGATTFTKKMKVPVINADILPVPEVAGHTIQLAASTDCPVGVSISTPDFGSGANSVTLAGGKSKKASVTLTVDATGIANLTTTNSKAPVRCSLTFTATTVTPAGSSDPVTSNNTAVVDVSFIDKHDQQLSTMHESAIKGLGQITVKVMKNATTKAAKKSVKIVNADFLPTVEVPGHSITVTASDGSCPAGTVGVIDYDKPTPGSQNSVVVKGGATKSGSLPLTIDPKGFHSGNAKSPARCVAKVSVSGPAGDVDDTNNTAHLVINVSDHNDF